MFEATDYDGFGSAWLNHFLRYTLSVKYILVETLAAHLNRLYKYLQSYWDPKGAGPAWFKQSNPTPSATIRRIFSLSDATEASAR